MQQGIHARSVDGIQCIGVSLFFSGALAGFTSGVFGVGGGFIVVPALLYVFSIFGYSSEATIFVAVGTSLATIIIASARAALTHHKLASVNIMFLKDWGPWILFGSSVGVAAATTISGSSLAVIFASGVGIYSMYFLFPAALDKFTLHDLPKGVVRACLGSSIGGFSVLLGNRWWDTNSYHYDALPAPNCRGGGDCRVCRRNNRTRWHARFCPCRDESDLSRCAPGSLGFINLPALLAIAACSIITAPLGARLAHRIDPLYLKRMFGLYLLTVSSAMFIQSF